MLNKEELRTIRNRWIDIEGQRVMWLVRMAKHDIPLLLADIEAMRLLVEDLAAEPCYSRIGDGLEGSYEVPCDCLPCQARRLVEVKHV